VCDAARNLKNDILATAAELMDCPPADLVLSDKRVVSRTDPAKSIALEGVAREFDEIGRSRKVIGLFDMSSLFPEDTRPEYTPQIVTGADLAQVLVDLETGQVEVKRVVASHDVGRAINPPGAKGQIRGAVMMGVGTALSEAYIPGVSTGFTDYVLPMESAMPDVEVILVEVPSFYGPLGAKGLGETPILPATPAIINAVSRAIGVRIRELPATPPCVLKAIRRGM
jgi:CO/xanthine dehydrogenase Mo-binding subunit